jgi:hypothetical protein
MARGGIREGAGRKAQGITKKVSLTLSTETWQEITQYENVACFIKSLMENKNSMNEVTKTNKHDTPITKNEIDNLWNSYLQDNKDIPIEIQDKAYKSLINGLKKLETGNRYRCPFTGKWFVDTQKLIKVAIPRLIDSYSDKAEKQKEKVERDKNNTVS